MADSLFTLSLLYALFTFFGTRDWRYRLLLIPQFFVGWLVIELAWFHAIIQGLFIVLAVLDFDDFGFSALIGLAIGAYNIYRFLQLHQQAGETHTLLQNNLRAALGDNFLKTIPESQLGGFELKTEKFKKPFSFQSPEVEVIHGVRYGDEPRNTLDIHKPKHATNKPKPVILQIHGGGWTIGNSRQQGLPLRTQMVEAGWIFVSINYSLSPKDKFPAHIIDCKKALHWIKNYIHEYGGDPDFIITTGGSAGGHLSSLLALTANKHQELLQPGFEDADLSVQGCMPMYGVYDFTDSHEHRVEMSMRDFLETYVMPETLEKNPELWQLASPSFQSDKNRPPFMVSHGTLDTLAFVEDARVFVDKLNHDDSGQLCIYNELPGTQHAFDIFYSPRCLATVYAMHSFSLWLYSQYLEKKA